MNKRCNDFFNHIGNYLSIEKNNYISSNNQFVIVRDKGKFTDVEKQKIHRFLYPYSYEINDNKIIIRK